MGSTNGVLKGGYEIERDVMGILERVGAGEWGVGMRKTLLTGFIQSHVNTWDRSPRIPFSLSGTNHVGTWDNLWHMLNSTLLTSSAWNVLTMHPPLHINFCSLEEKTFAFSIVKCILWLSCKMFPSEWDKAERGTVWGKEGKQLVDRQEKAVQTRTR